MVSHELKTPLTSLNGFSQLLQLKAKKNGDVYCSDVLVKILIQIKKTSSMINGFLDISRPESGKIHLNKSEFNFVELLIEIIEETQLTIVSHVVKFEQSNDEIIINADRDKIGSVISTLVSNVIKYSSKSNLVIIETSVVGNNLTLCVKDEGMGIAKDDLSYRVETSEIQHISGFGIGLYLSAEIVQRHQGKIWVDSEISKGSTFCFTLPL